MKDDRLEKEFGEYFEGVNPPENITGDAKKYVKPRSAFLPKFVKFASVAASFVLVFAAALTVILNVNSNKADNFVANAPDYGDSAAAPDTSGDGNSGTSDFDAPNYADSDPTPPSDGNTAADDGTGGKDPKPDGTQEGATGFKYYSDADLNKSEVSARSLSELNGALKFMEGLTEAEKKCSAGYLDGKLALAEAEVSFNGDETKIYVEFTDKSLIYVRLSDYYNGSKNQFRGTEYYLTKTASGSGFEYKMLINYGGVKYYFKILSSDETAYEKYLDLIIN